MRCHLVRAQLQDLLEDRVPPRVMACMREHLASCQGCAIALSTWQGLWDGLHGLVPCPETPDLEARIMAVLSQPPDLPKFLVFLFGLASLGAIAGFLAWSEGLAAQRSLISACLWVVAGVAAVFSVWLAVERSQPAEAMNSKANEVRACSQSSN